METSINVEEDQRHDLHNINDAQSLVRSNSVVKSLENDLEDELEEKEKELKELKEKY